MIGDILNPLFNNTNCTDGSCNESSDNSFIVLPQAECGPVQDVTINYGSGSNYLFQNGLREQSNIVKLGLDLSTLGSGNIGLLTEPTYLIYGDFTLDNFAGAIFDNTTGTVSIINSINSNNSALLQVIRDNNRPVISLKRTSNGNIQSIGFGDYSTDAMNVVDDVNNKGLEYQADYSNNFTDHSLITKKWVFDQSYISVIPSQYMQDGDNISRLFNNVGYITSSDIPAAQVLSWTVNSGTLSISGGNSVVLDGRYSLLGHTHPISDIIGLQAALDGKVDKTTSITDGYGITVGGNLSTGVSIALNTSIVDNRYIRKDQDDDNGSNVLTLGGLITGDAELNGTVTLGSVAIGTTNDILLYGPGGEIQRKTLSIAGEFGIANGAGTNQFDVSLGTDLLFEGANDTTVSFDPVTKKIIISSIPGTGGGGAVLSYNTRTGAVVSVTGDYNTDMVPETGSPTNMYYTNARTISSILTGYSTGANSTITATDTILQALQKAQGQINARVSSSRTLTINGTSGNITVAGGTQDLSANRTWDVNLATTGISAGVYTKVTIDTFGRATAGTTLIESDIPNLDADKITSGIFDTGRLGSGTPSSTTYLNGDGSWVEFPVIPDGISNLALGTRTSTTMPITNSNGTGVTLIEATSTLAGLLTASDKAKLDSLEGPYVTIDTEQTITGDKTFNNVTYFNTLSGISGGGDIVASQVNADGMQVSDDPTDPIDVANKAYVDSQSVIEALDEGNGIGYRIRGRDPDNYGNIGQGAVDFSTSNGASTTLGATGQYSFAVGRETEASETYSSAFGDRTTASGNSSAAFGFQTTASGSASSAYGFRTTASGFGSAAYGSQTETSGDYSAAFGNGTIANEYASLAIGLYSTDGPVETSWTTGSPVFKVGNGAGTGNRSNAYVLNNDGTSTQYGIASYGADYSASFTDRSLVDKAYVDANTGTIQTLSLGSTAGNIAISEGNSVDLKSLGRTSIGDFNSFQTVAGLYPMYNSSGATGYPSELGGGILFQRNNNNNTGGFALWTPNTGTNNLYVNIGSGSSWNGWEILATREWSDARFYSPSNLVSAYGGGTVGSTNADTFLSGHIASYSTGNWLSNGYFTGVDGYGGLISFNYNSGEGALQINYSFGHVGNKSRMAFRSQNQSGFTPWEEVATRGWTSDNYLPLTGGTLTGLLTITTPTWPKLALQSTTPVGNTGLRFLNDTGNSKGYVGFVDGATDRFYISNQTANSLHIRTNNIDRITIGGSGGTTLYGAMTTIGSNYVGGPIAPQGSIYITKHSSTDETYIGGKGTTGNESWVLSNFAFTDDIQLRLSAGGILATGSINGRDALNITGSGSSYINVSGNTAGLRLSDYNSTVNLRNFSWSNSTGQVSAGLYNDDWSSQIKQLFSINLSTYEFRVNDKIRSNIIEAESQIIAPTFTRTTQGLVPTPGGSGNTRFLREDGTWNVPPGGGTVTPTDLSLGTRNSTTITINSSTGTNVTIPAATTSLAGLFQASDKVKLNGLTNYSSGSGISVSGSTISANFGTTAGTVAQGNHTHAFAQITATPTTLGGYGITNAVLNSRTITAGTGLSGGGNLIEDRTISANFGTSAGTIAQGNDSRINNGQTAYGWGDHAGKYLALSAVTTGEASNYSGDLNNLKNSIVYDAGGTNGQGVNSTILSIAGSNTYGFQLSSRNQNRFKYRSKEAGVWSDWQTIWTSAYLRSNSENDARYFLQPTGSTSQYIRGDGSLATLSNSHTHTWSQLSGGSTGLIPGAGSSGSFGALDISGSKGSYSGIRFTGTSGNLILMMHASNNLTGVYRTTPTTNWLWGWNGDGELQYGTVPWARLSGVPSYVPTSRTVTAGNGLSGGGSLSGNITISLTGPTSVTLSSGNTVGSGSHTHAFAPGGTTAQYIRGDGSLATLPTGYVPTSRTINIAGSTGITTTGGTQSLAANRAWTIAVDSTVVRTSGTQTIGGAKTFSSTLTGTTAHFTGDVIAYYSSDERLKDNIKAIINPLEKLSKISGNTFTWNDKQDVYSGEDYGVIAQEIEKVLPHAVITRDNGFKAVKYEKVIPLLIEAVKELTAKVNELEGR